MYFTVDHSDLALLGYFRVLIILAIISVDILFIDLTNEIEMTGYIKRHYKTYPYDKSIFNVLCCFVLFIFESKF